MIEDECEETDVHLYKLPEFSEVKCSSDADAQAPKIIGRLYAGYQDADVRDSTTSADVALKPNPGLFKRVLRPERYELNDRQVYRGHGANIGKRSLDCWCRTMVAEPLISLLSAVHGDIGGRNKGAVLADFGFGQIGSWRLPCESIAFSLSSLRRLLQLPTVGGSWRKITSRDMREQDFWQWEL